MRFRAFAIMLLFYYGGRLMGNSFSVTPAEQEYLISGQQSQTVEFSMPAALQKGEYINLQFDGFLKYKKYSGYDCCMTITLNGKTIEGDQLLNVPTMFLRNNGMDSISFHWRFNRFYLLYAPSLEAAQSDNCQYRPLHWNGTTYRFNITKYVQPGKNTLTFNNGQRPDVHRLFNDTTPIPMVIGNIEIVKTDTQPTPAEEWWVTELKELNENPRYIEPRKSTDEEFSYKVETNGLLVINSGTATYRLDSFFSYPNGGYNAFGANHLESPEKGFAVNVQASGSTTKVDAKGQFYTIERSIAKHGNYLSVKDILTSVVDEPIGVITR